MRFLRPIIAKPDYHELIHKELDIFLKEILYIPVLKIMKEDIKEITNDIDYISRALRNGQIDYINGAFSGKFNSKLVKQFNKLGAKFDKRTGFYKIDLRKLSYLIQSNIAISKMEREQINKEVISYLDFLEETKLYEEYELFDKRIGNKYSKIINDLDQQYSKSFTNIAVEPKITPIISDNLKNDYTKNMNLYIKNWTEENIIKLREEVYKNVMEGGRSINLVKILQKNYNVSESKAKFLAKQETSLLTSKYREQRYTSIGVYEYEWNIRGFRTRPDHRVLNGRIFNWANPPITNTKTSARNNPGEDYGCYCTAKPIVRF